MSILKVLKSGMHLVHRILRPNIQSDIDVERDLNYCLMQKNIEIVSCYLKCLIDHREGCQQGTPDWYQNKAQVTYLVVYIYLIFVYSLALNINVRN